ncbi:MAG: DUF523 and DUF1722 domain-containing protein [Gammaproteobacteria bacterium]
MTFHTKPDFENPRIPVGISRCLLGEEVRYNGSHKLSKYCRDQLGPYFDYQDVCPEVEIGMGIPREPIRLVEFGSEDDSRIRVLEIKDGSRDYTDALTSLADAKQPQLEQLCGFIFMQNSPSCGAFRVKAYHPNGNVLHTQGQGAFAGRLMKLMPWLPVEESGRLLDAQLRENFITRVFALYHWQKLVSHGLTRKAIIDFHSGHKYLVMAHSQRHYKLIGKLLSRAGFYSVDLLATRYRNLFMHGLKQRAGRKGNANALQHMQGYLRDKLDKDAKADITRVIESYRLGEVPLIVPLTLLRHYSDLAGDYFAGQSFLAAHPKRLGLNNQI